MLGARIVVNCVCSSPFIYLHAVATVVRAFPDLSALGTGTPALRTRAPIVQVQAWLTVHGQVRVLVRTLTTLLLGTLSSDNEHTPRQDEPRFFLRVHDTIRTGKHVCTRMMDVHAAAEVTRNDRTYAVDTHGTVRLWDAAAKTTTVLASLEAVQDDRWWKLASSTPYILYASSCYDVHAIDTRAPEPSMIFGTSYSPQAMRRAKVTSLTVSQLPMPSTVLAVATTDAVQYYDVRFPTVPWSSWNHQRGFDRTLSLHRTNVEGGEYLILSSQKNRLHTVYGAQADDTHALTFDMPHILRSTVPYTQVTAASPTPPAFATSLNSSGGSTHSSETLWHVEQTMRGSLWMQLVQASSAAPDDEPIQVAWTHGLCKRAENAKQTYDPGPFGQMEVTQMDFRAVFKGMYARLGIHIRSKLFC